LGLRLTGLSGRDSATCWAWAWPGPLITVAAAPCWRESPLGGRATTACCT